MMAIVGISAQVETDNAPEYITNKMKQFFAQCNIKHVTGIPHNATEQVVTERYIIF